MYVIVPLLFFSRYMLLAESADRPRVQLSSATLFDMCSILPAAADEAGLRPGSLEEQEFCNLAVSLVNPEEISAFAVTPSDVGAGIWRAVDPAGKV